MQQCFLGVLNCSWEQQDGESVPAAGQCLGVGSGSGAWAWGSSQPLTSSAFLGTQEMSWCLRRDSFSLISPHSAPSLLHTFFVFCLVAPLEIPSPPLRPARGWAAPSTVSLPLWWLQGLLRAPTVQPIPAPVQKPQTHQQLLFAQWKGLLF